MSSDRRERNTGEFAAEIGGVALAVLGVVEDGVDVVEDVPLGDGGVVVVGAEFSSAQSVIFSRRWVPLRRRCRRGSIGFCSKVMSKGGIAFIPQKRPKVVCRFPMPAMQSIRFSASDAAVGEYFRELS